MDQCSCRCIGRQEETTVIFDRECPKVVDRFRERMKKDKSYYMAELR
jgi:hypothetical protein